MINWLYKTKFLAGFKLYIARKVREAKIAVIFYRNPEQSKVFDVVNEIKNTELGICVTNNEAMQIAMGTINTAKLGGVIAEVGCFKGGSAELICRFKGNREFHVFDCFEAGLQDVQDIDNKAFKDGEFKTGILANGMYGCSEQGVRKRLEKYANVFIHKGYFPKTAKPILNKKFSFVNLDVDTYTSTKACLEFFYPRMVKGGVILSHDYVGVRGVRNAFDEFFKDKQVPLIEMSGSQVLVVK